MHVLISFPGALSELYALSHLLFSGLGSSCPGDPINYSSWSPEICRWTPVAQDNSLWSCWVCCIPSTRNITSLKMWLCLFLCSYNPCSLSHQLLAPIRKSLSIQPPPTLLSLILSTSDVSLISANCSPQNPEWGQPIPRVKFHFLAKFTSPCASPVSLPQVWQYLKGGNPSLYCSSAPECTPDHALVQALDHSDRLSDPPPWAGQVPWVPVLCSRIFYSTTNDSQTVSISEQPSPPLASPSLTLVPATVHTDRCPTWD